MDARLSKTFNLLRFPLIVLVVFIHTFDGAVTINGMQIEGGGNLLSRPRQPYFARACSYCRSLVLFHVGVSLFQGEQFIGYPI